MNKLKILLGITGSIAAYKAPELIRRLKDCGYDIKVVLTESAKAFVTPLSLQAVSGQMVYEKLLDVDAENAMGHIALARWAEIILIAPASANFIARIAHGFADDLLSTVCLTAQTKIVLVPAMNQAMWQNAATQDNVKTLQGRKINFLGPDTGIQACGETGPGRMLEPDVIIQNLAQYACEPFLKGKKILITAGPTQEPLDPVRYLSNRSSGKMGYALAKSAVDAGADVCLISGPVALMLPTGVRVINVKTADEMLQAVKAEIAQQDIFIAAAAVADYKFVKISSQKIKKTPTSLTLELIPTPDILAYVGKLKRKPFVVGFAAETDNLISHAKNKLINKKADLIIANDVSNAEIGFDSDDNAVIAITKNTQQSFAKASKQVIAQQILHVIAEQLIALN